METIVEKTVWDKIERGLNRHIVYTILLLTIVLTLTFPIGIPIGIGSDVKRAYELIDALPSGANVAVEYGLSAGVWPEVGPATLAIMQHLFTKDIKIMIFAIDSAHGPIIFEEKIINAIDKHGKEYGKDWVNIGFFAGQEVAVSAIAFDTKGVAINDFFGTPINELPLMEGFNSAEDWDLFIQMGVIPVETFLRQIPSGTKYLFVTGLMSATFNLPYIESGQIYSVVGGTRGGAEYEILIGKPGDAIANFDALTMGYILTLLLVIIGNVTYFGKQRALKRKERK